ITVAITDRGGASTAVQSAADVSDAPLTAAGLALAADSGAALIATVATFTDANPASSSGDFTATIQWGDGRTTPGSVTADPRGGFLVSGSHLYSVAGSYTIRTSILDRDGALVIANGSIAIAEPAIQTDAESIRATEGTPFAGTIASFSFGDSGRDVAGIVAAIDWSNGHTSRGLIGIDVASGRFLVFGSIIYADEGEYPVTITIEDQSGVLATLSTTATVVDAPLAALPVTVSAIQGTTFTGIVAMFSD